MKKEQLIAVQNRDMTNKDRENVGKGIRLLVTTSQKYVKIYVRRFNAERGTFGKVENMGAHTRGSGARVYVNIGDVITEEHVGDRGNRTYEIYTATIDKHDEIGMEDFERRPYDWLREVRV